MTASTGASQSNRTCGRCRLARTLGQEAPSPRGGRPGKQADALAAYYRIFPMVMGRPGTVGRKCPGPLGQRHRHCSGRFERFGVDVIEDFDARPANGQDRIDLRHLGISAGNFEERVTITDLGGATLVAVEDAGAILCRGVNGEGRNAITIEDFGLLP